MAGLMRTGERVQSREWGGRVNHTRDHARHETRASVRMRLPSSMPLPNSTGAPCCTEPAPEASRMGRCVMMSRCDDFVEGAAFTRYCPVECGVCTICVGHPMHRLYSEMWRSRRHQPHRTGAMMTSHYHPCPHGRASVSRATATRQCQRVYTRAATTTVGLGAQPH